MILASYSQDSSHTANSIKILVGLLLLLIFNSSVEAAPETLPDNEFKQLLKEAIESKSEFNDRFDAQVWLMDMSNRLDRHAKRIPLDERMRMLKAVHREATRAGLDPQLVLALIQTESDFNRFAVSKVGARGLMQIMPFWIEEIGHESDNLFDIDTNLRYGCAILKIYLGRENNQVTKALARYYGAINGMTYPNKVLTRLRKNWHVVR
jgi:soluble lytic murein transglycosylase-like protein